MRTGFFLAIATLAVASIGSAEDWPQFRGPHFNGTSDATGVPDQFSQTENVRWSLDLAGPSAATPIVLGDRIFMSSTNLENDQLLAMCVDRNNGEVLWQHEVAAGIRRDTRSTFSAPSPATDGNVVVFFYGNGELVTYDLDGGQQWRSNLGPFAFLWTFSTSPLIDDGRLIMQVLQRDVPVGRRSGGRGRGRGRPDAQRGQQASQPAQPQEKIESYLLALDPKTGEELWRHVRPSQAVAESLEAFSTPVPLDVNGRRQLLVVGGDAVTGHDPATGEELWRWGTWNPERIPHWRLVPSPVAGDGVVLVSAPKREPIYAVPLGKQGTLSDDALRWVSKATPEVSTDVPTPAFYDGDFFVLSDVRNTLSRIDPATGKPKWALRTPGRSKYEASPTIADGKVFIVNFDGEVTVVDAADGSILNTVAMEPDLEVDAVVRSSVVPLDGQLLIRTNTRLWCIAQD